jgi:hypothetical protein
VPYTRCVAKAFPEWTVLKHSEIVQAQANLWHVEGAIPNMALRRRMTIIRRDDGGLVLHSPMALDAKSMEFMESLGPISYILVPNGWHRLDAPNYRKRYPNAKLLCPKGSKKKVSEVVEVDGSYEDFPNDSAIAIEYLEGVKKLEGVLTVRDGGETALVFNDCLFNIRHGKGVAGLLFRIIGSSGGPKVTRIMRLFAIKDKEALRAQLETLATTEGLCRLIPGHGEPIEEDASGTLRKVASTL